MIFAEAKVVAHITVRRILNVTIMLLLVSFSLALSGCQSNGLGAEGMMRPPRAGGDGGAIQDALTETLGTQISLRYPRSGDNRSAVVRSDVDNDGTDEAIVFYRLATEGNGAHMILLDTNEYEHWSAVGEASVTGGEIDRIMFGDIDGDGSLDIITGWSLFSGSSKVITAYRYADGALSELEVYSDANNSSHSTAVYNELTVGDFDADHCAELMSVTLNVQSKTASVSMLEYTLISDGYNAITTTSTALLDGSMVEYINAQAGWLTETIFGLVLDGHRGDSLTGNEAYTTELVYYNPLTGRLQTPLNNQSDHTAFFVRSCATKSTDIDDNGVIDLPTDHLLPGFSPTDSDALYLTTWHCYLYGRETTVVSTMLVRDEEGYYLEFPDEWNGIITAAADPTLDLIYFCAAEGQPNAGAELMRIQVFTLDEWEDEVVTEPLELLESDANPAFIELATTDYYVYGVLISIESEQYNITYDTVLNGFHIVG